MILGPQDDHHQDEGLVAEFNRYEGMENRSARTRQSGGFILKSLSRFLHGRGKTILTAEREDIQSYLWCGQQKNRTRNTELSRIKSMYKWLRMRNRIKSDPTIFIFVDRDWRSIPAPLSKEEVERLMAAIPKYPRTPLGMALALRDEAYAPVIYASGGRATEVLRLQVDAFDRESGSILVKGKGGKDRTIHLAPPAREKLIKYLDEGRPLLAKRRAPDEPDDEQVVRGGGYIFLTRRGTASTRDWLLKIIKKSDKNATVHRIRHSTASHLVADGASMEDVQELLGQDKIEVTRGYVQYLSLDRLRAELGKYGPHAPGKSEERSNV